MWKNKGHKAVFDAFMASGEVAGEGFVLCISEIAADAVVDELREPYRSNKGSRHAEDLDTAADYLEGRYKL